MMNQLLQASQLALTSQVGNKVRMGYLSAPEETPVMETVYYRFQDDTLTGRDFYQAALDARKAKLSFKTAQLGWLGYLLTGGKIPDLNPLYLRTKDILKALQEKRPFRYDKKQETEARANSCKVFMQRLQELNLVKTVSIAKIFDLPEDRWRLMNRNDGKSL